MNAVRGRISLHYAEPRAIRNWSASSREGSYKHISMWDADCGVWWCDFLSWVSWGDLGGAVVALKSGAVEHTWWRAGSQLPDCADVSHRQAGGSHGPTLSNVKVTHGPPARCSHTLHYIYKVSTVMASKLTRWSGWDSAPLWEQSSKCSYLWLQLQWCPVSAVLICNSPVV